MLDLETLNQQQAATATSLQQQLLAAKQQVESLESQLATWQARGVRAEELVADLQQQLGARTPRPRRDLGVLTDLLTAGEAQMVEQALIAGEDLARSSLARYN